TVKLWEVATGRERVTLERVAERFLTVALASDGQTMAAAGEGNWGRLWDLAHGEAPRTLAGADPVGLSPGGPVLATASLNLHDLTAGAVRTLPGRAQEVTCLAFAPDSRTLALGNHYGTAQVWDLANQQVRWTWRERTGPILAVAFAPDGATMATGSQDGT